MNESNFVISIVISTYNRCESLRDTLDSLLQQELTNDIKYEAIVVDNNSKDKTREVVESYIPEFNSRLRYIFESKQGLSFARNRGIKEAKGQIIAFTDDDVVVDKNWVANIYKTFCNNSCDALGGKILPIWLRPKPNWISKKLYGNLALLDYGDVFLPLKTKETVFYGANFAVKKNVFDEVGDFNVMLGREGKKLFGWEDIDLFNRLHRNNKNIYYQPNCIVYHKIDYSRLKKGYFRKWHFYDGQLKFKLNSNFYRDSKKKYPLGIPFWLLKSIGNESLIYLYKKLRNNCKSDEIFIHELRICNCLGSIVGAWNLKG